MALGDIIFTSGLHTKHSGGSIVKLLVLHIEDIVLHRFLCDGMDGLFCVPQKPKEASALSGVEVE